MDVYFDGSKKEIYSENSLRPYTFTIFSVSFRMSNGKNFMLCNKLW